MSKIKITNDSMNGTCTKVYIDDILQERVVSVDLKFAVDELNTATITKYVMESDIETECEIVEDKIIIDDSTYSNPKKAVSELYMKIKIDTSEVDEIILKLENAIEKAKELKKYINEQQGGLNEIL